MGAMSKTKAIHYARERVSDLSPFGDGYVFLSFDDRCNAWRESIPQPWSQAQVSRSQRLLDIARGFLGLDPVPYDGGRWADCLDD